jgi:hypothetical protein
MLTRFSASAGALAIALTAGLGSAQAQDGLLGQAGRPQKPRSAKSAAPVQLGPLGATAESVLAAGRRLNPALRAAALDTSAAAAKVESAGALDDPMISDNYQFYRNPNVFSGHAITVTQAFPLWGKRSLRQEAALADLDAMRGREQAARDVFDERIKVAFAQYYVASRALAVNREVIALARALRSAAEARYGAGQGDRPAAVFRPDHGLRGSSNAPVDGGNMTRPVLRRRSQAACLLSPRRLQATDQEGCSPMHGGFDENQNNREQRRRTIA